jgi:NDP-sugar pyrophosphorylase family protein
MIDTAVVLAGGLGSRLAPLTHNCPKPLVTINESPFIRYLLQPLKQQGIKEVILLTGYLAEQFTEHFERYPVEGMKITCMKGELEWDTGKRLSEVKHYLPEIFMVLYADNYWVPDIAAMCRQYMLLGKPVMATIFDNVMGTAEYGTENNIKVDRTGQYVLDYNYDRSNHDTMNGVDIGYFIVNRTTVIEHQDAGYSLKDWMKNLIDHDQMGAYVTSQQYYFITSPYLRIMFEYYAQNVGLENV